MGPSHIDEILEIERTLFTTPWTRVMFEQEVGVRSHPDGFGTYSVVAAVDGRVAGYAVAWFIDEGVHLMNIAVRKEFQRRGIGRRLLADLVVTASAANKRFIVLEVRASNTVAQTFYRKFSFASIGLRPGYYSDNREDALLMSLDLGTRAARAKRETGKRKTD